MNKKALLTNVLLFVATALFAQNKNTVLFDNNWSFFRGGALGAEQPDFNDSKWRKVDLPHDWSIEDLPGAKSPFNAAAISQVAGGFTTGGTGWYRKAFTLPAAQKGKRVIIQFDGVYMNASVYVNGQDIGSHPYGYTSFWFDITDKIKAGEKNIIAVEVKNEGQNSRWYSGSGIYRHVWLKVVDQVHIAQWGASITTPEVSVTSAKVSIATKVLNEGEKDDTVHCLTHLINSAGKEIGVIRSEQLIKAGSSFSFSQDAFIPGPALWNCGSPNLYSAVTEIMVNGKQTDEEKTPFGIRKVRFDTKNGFRLNDTTVKLKGGCFHNDNGPLGSKAYDRAEERKVELLKASGFNAVRCSHNPPSPAFLAACDRLGMLVIDEAFDCWKYGKNPYDYHLYFNDWWKKDVESMVLRDRSHPSVIMWSIGNEIPERGRPEGAAEAKMLGDFIKNIDPTRYVTAAVSYTPEDREPYFNNLDVCGYNYAIGDNVTLHSLYEADHKRVPGRIMMGTESYPLAAFGNWMDVLDHPYIIGDFVWTAWDYIGEASIGWLGYMEKSSFYPWNLAFCGDIDICGWKRPQSYYRDALWKTDQLSIFITPPKPSFAVNPKIESWSEWNWLDAAASWNWRGYENKPLAVNVYSSCKEAELFLNGKSLGKKATNRSTQFIATWNVPYQTGTLTAAGYDNDKKVNTAILKTASIPINIKAAADRIEIKANNQDLSYVTVGLTDANGTIDPLAENQLRFKLEGPGKIVGVGNANPMSLESDQLPQRKAWQGKCLVIIKSTEKPGAIKLTVSSDGIAGAVVSIRSL